MRKFCLPLCADDADCDGSFELERTADGDHPFADIDLIGVAEIEEREIFSFDFDDGDIGMRISADKRRIHLAAVIEDSCDFIGAFDDVGICHDVAVCAH